MPCYFITWTTYGTWLHGDERGSVDDEHNAFKTPVLPKDTRTRSAAIDRMGDDPYRLGQHNRLLVEQVILRHCEFRGWRIHTLNVRTNHIHIVCDAPVAPEKVMGGAEVLGQPRAEHR